jgi:hypothetical protein
MYFTHKCLGQRGQMPGSKRIQEEEQKGEEKGTESVTISMPSPSLVNSL